MAGVRTDTHAKKAAFLAAYAELGTTTGAAAAAKIERKSHWNWAQNDPAYVQAFELAKLEAAERLEEEARRRAVVGVEEPVHYQGKRVDTVKKYSDTLLIFLMKGAMPQKYKENQGNALNVGGDLNIQLNVTNQLTLIMAEAEAHFPGILAWMETRMSSLGDGGK